jgi:hypothetical protein
MIDFGRKPATVEVLDKLLAGGLKNHVCENPADHGSHHHILCLMCPQCDNRLLRIEYKQGLVAAFCPCNSVPVLLFKVAEK